MAKLSIEQKSEFINENREAFFKSPKTSSEEYQTSFNELDVEKQYATILRWKKYNEKKAAGETVKRVFTKKLNPVEMLMNGEDVEINSDAAENLISKFETAIEKLREIIEKNKENEKLAIENQIKELQERLADLG